MIQHSNTQYVGTLNVALNVNVQVMTFSCILYYLLESIIIITSAPSKEGIFLIVNIEYDWKMNHYMNEECSG